MIRYFLILLFLVGCHTPTGFVRKGLDTPPSEKLSNTIVYPHLNSDVIWDKTLMNLMDLGFVNLDNLVSKKDQRYITVKFGFSEFSDLSYYLSCNRLEISDENRLFSISPTDKTIIYSLLRRNHRDTYILSNESYIKLNIFIGQNRNSHIRNIVGEVYDSGSRIKMQRLDSSTGSTVKFQIKFFIDIKGNVKSSQKKINLVVNDIHEALTYNLPKTVVFPGTTTPLLCYSTGNLEKEIYDRLNI